MSASLLVGFLLSLGLVFAQAPATRTEFEVASIKRNVSGARPWLAPPVGVRFTATNVTLKLLIGVGWPQKISGGPLWVTTDGYDVSAKEPDPDVSRDEFALMMQNLLNDRFSLRVHTETHQAPVYILRSAKNGLKLPGANAEPCFTGVKPQGANPQSGCGAMNVTPGSIVSDKVSIGLFADVLGGLLGRPVIDKTGFTGSFKVRLEFAPVAPGGDSDGMMPSLFTVLQEQLGLRLESRKGTEKVLVIDHVERPAGN